MSWFPGKEKGMICRYCGTEFEPKKRGRKNTGFCCKHCADNWRKHNVYDLLPRKYRAVCERCGAVFKTNNRGQRYCSCSCSARASRRTYRAERTCSVCGQTFTAITPNDVFCSEACRHRAKRDREQDKRRRRRAMTGDHREGKLSLDKVYADAEGQCSVCGLPVPLACDRNDVWSRTRDHIIPITLNGAHTYSNCQLAHRICNSIKKQEGEDFHIEWESKFESDPDRWGPKLIHLDDLLHEETATATEGPPPGSESL